MTISLAMLTTALLFGGMTLYSFGFAAFLFTALPAATAGTTLRRAFPLFYMFVMATAAVAGLLWWSHSVTYAIVMAMVALTTLPVWRLLMPAINRATDAGERQRFKWLHALSVLVTLAHIIAVGWLLVQLV
jgi:Flp pilus assembly protein TadB